MQNIITYIIIAAAIIGGVYLFWKKWFSKPHKNRADDSCSSCDDSACSNCDGCNLKNELKNRSQTKKGRESE